MATYAPTALRRLVDTFEAHRDPARAAPMAAYMRNLFAYLGIPTPERRRLTRVALAGVGRPGEATSASLPATSGSCQNASTSTPASISCLPT